ncbi:MAG: reverse transcriptase family protein [Pseudomonadota bacterium]
MRYDPYRRLAALILAEGCGSTGIEACIQKALKGRKSKSASIAREIQEHWVWPYPPSEASLAALLRRSATSNPRDIPLCFSPAAARPLVHEGLPELETPPALADWLDLNQSELYWFADCEDRRARDPDRRGHYTQIWLRKRGGGIRLVEAPLPRLKALQRRVLRELLDHVPPHPDSFGFVRGRDCRGAAIRHTGEDVVIRYDLRDFFPSVPARRVHAIFRTIGYGPSVARLLTGLVTTRSPADAVLSLEPNRRPEYRAAHLPQGAPTSPTLANLAAWSLDQRLSGLARRLGANYARYADDITLSGPRALAFEGAVPVTEIVGEIVRDCGFRLNRQKTRVQRRGNRQTVTGVVVNAHLNVPRPEFDRLKAILTNAIRHGAAAQNRDQHADFRAHLEGRIGWVAGLNPRRAEKLYALFDRIDWTL